MEEEKNEEEKTYAPWSYTQDFKKSIRNLAPQHLIDAPTRQKICNSPYFMQYCFGVNLVTFVDRAQLLKGVGGIYGTYKQPTNFICLFFKLLELEPSEKVIEYFINTKCWQMKHLRLLAALYVRFAYPPSEVYQILESLLNHYEKIAIMTDDGYVLSHFDEIIYSFLKEKLWCGIQLPPLTPRINLPPRISQLSNLIEHIKIDVFQERGMDPDGNLFEVLEEKKKLRLNGKKLVLKKQKVKPKQITSEEPKDSIEEDNRIRLLLGLPLLKI